MEGIPRGRYVNGSREEVVNLITEEKVPMLEVSR